MFVGVTITGMSMASQVESASVLLYYDAMAFSLLCRRYLDRVDTFLFDAKS
jgi:hypothetical protein